MLINIGDVVDGALVSAIAVAGRRISVAVDGLRGRRRLNDLTAARWFETYRMTSEAPGLPELPAALTERLAEVLRGEEAQAALHELLAVRLTDAPEANATAARQVLSLTLTTADARAARFAEALAGYYDDQVCALVARLEADDPPLLAQIRSDAFSARMINILNAIERHTAALATRPAQRSEADFLARYRRHVIDQYGKLDPPDFDRRRRVPIADIYVPTTIAEEPSAGPATASRPARQPSLDVYDLAGRLDRSVLLGDPGGGKTTAANVLMHHFARHPDGRIPFLVTLRDYAATDPPQRSVAGHIEHTLETFYQCPAPPGLVDVLLLTGRAVVILDGLDELLDTSRRADVTTRVERFCAEYPLAPVLVTSRQVGYDQARLDDGQFTCYRLGQLADAQVGEFARKWFGQDDEIRAGEADSWAEAFLSESAAASDLRTNPLLLSLLCILYRGEGSLPRDRAEVYEQCAMLMFRRWDARRRIRQDLRAGHLLEPVLRHLAWLLFTRENAQSAMTERELVTATTEFLQARGFESQDAAREFVNFCRGRMWVFSDAGTAASGERLYAFTHRTFLEYFAAAQVAYDSDTPEQLARAIAPYVAVEQWWVVAELAIQIKDRTSNGGAERVYAAMLGELGRQAEERSDILRFLALCLRSVDPSPPRVRELTRQLFEEVCQADEPAHAGETLTGLPSEGPPENFMMWRPAWSALLTNCGRYRETVAGEIDAAVEQAVVSGHRDLVVSVRLTLSLPDALSDPGGKERQFWSSYILRFLGEHRATVVTAAETDAYVRTRAVENGLVTVGRALRMAEGPRVAFGTSQGCFDVVDPFFQHTFYALINGWPFFGEPAAAANLETFGSYLMDHHEPPWLRGGLGYSIWVQVLTEDPDAAAPAPLSRAACLGVAAILPIMLEAGLIPAGTEFKLGPLDPVVPYLECREGRAPGTALPDLPVPDEFRQTLRDWADGRVSVTAPD